MANGTTASDLEVQLNAAEEHATLLTEEALKSQDLHHKEAVEQLKRNVEQLVEDNNSLFDPVDLPREIDPTCISGRIVDLAQLTQQLKSTHLQQETLDNFLRYTISSTDILQLDSEKDERYVSVSKAVNQLQDSVIIQLDSEVDQIKQDIRKTGQTIADQREVLNELCLETGNLVDECHTLLTELEEATLTREVAEKQVAIEVTHDHPVEEMYASWQLLKEEFHQESHLRQHLNQLKRSKGSLEAILGARNVNEHKTPDVIKEYASYEALIRFWISKFINKEMENLEVFPRSNKFQFTHRMTEVVVSLGSRGISHVELYGKGIPLEKLAAARENVNEEASREGELYMSINRILDIIKEHATIS
ncbi:LAQU0S15e00518g1_1 [Lachancea quebecensis]|uniref:Spindle pole body component KRE28 n=1 Tax=Lachancea quebecensis TaxID=1654605 RepID=A0A0P1KW27_9SACH|nr:LAQU0S15e00518g1_1 [Lachancea quebecensis]